MDESAMATTTVRCWACGAEYTPLVVHSVSGPGLGARIPRHERDDHEGEPCPAGGCRVPFTS